MVYLRCRQNKLPLLYYQFNHNHNHDNDDDTKQTCIQRLPVTSTSLLTSMTDFHGFYQPFYRIANIAPSNRPGMSPSKSLLSHYS